MTAIEEAHSQQNTEAAPGKQNTAPEFNFPNILSQLKMAGLVNFAEDNGIDCIKLRAALPKKVVDTFCTLKWKVDRGGVRVKTSDYAAVSSIDSRCPWTKVAILMHQYLRSEDEKDKPQPAANKLGTFQGREETKVTRLNQKVVQQLRNSAPLLMQEERKIRKCLKHYNVDDQTCDSVDAGKLVEAGARVMGAIGKNHSQGWRVTRECTG